MLDPNNKEDIIATDIAKVFIINLSLSEIFGVEYRTPIRAILDAKKIPAVLPIKTGIAIPTKLVAITNISAASFRDTSRRDWTLSLSIRTIKISIN